MAARVDRLIERLTTYSSPCTFNQYRQVDVGFDRPGAAAIRLANLRRFLQLFAGARFLLVGEAAGYAGCRFSGIPFTCEAQIVGPTALPWTVGARLRASSVRESPWEERSARAVWGALGARRDCLLWNAFPWHPCCAANPLSNRAPGREVRAGIDVLGMLLDCFPGAQPVAVGRVAHRALAELATTAPYIRHPSHGGRHAFEAGLAAL